MNILRYLDTFLTKYHQYFPIARSLTRTLILILPKSAKVPEKFITTLIELMEIHHVITVSPPTYPIRSLALTSALTTISPYVETLFPNSKMKYSILFPIQILRSYYSFQYFMKSGFSLIPSTNSMNIILKRKDIKMYPLTPQQSIMKFISETIHSLRPLLVLISFSVYGDDSFVPFCVSFVSAAIEFLVLYKNSDCFTPTEKSIFRNRMIKMWVLFLFPVILKSFKKNKYVQILLKSKIPGIRSLLNFINELLFDKNISELLN